MKLRVVILKIFVIGINICLILVAILKILNTIVILIKKVVGKTEDEFNGLEIDEFVGLKSKMHSLLAKNGMEVNKAQGGNLVLRHNLYFDVLCNKKVIRHKMKRILSEKH